MPYRRLPNTDKARLRALEAAAKMGITLPPFKLAYSQASFSRLRMFTGNFQKAIVSYRTAYDTQVERNKELNASAKKARLYLSHFVQVLNLAIHRGDLPDKVRLSLGLDEDEKKLPDFTLDKDLIEWGKIIIQGETQRISLGQPPITNPTIAVVKVRYENFIEAFNNQRILQRNTQRFKDELDSLRKEADALIVTIWDEVEDFFKDLQDQERRERAQEYGLVYVFRKNELKELQLFGRIDFDD